MLLFEHPEVTESLFDPSTVKVADNLERSGPPLVLIFLRTKSQALLFWHALWPKLWFLDSDATRRTRAIDALFFFVLCGGLVGDTVSLLQHMTTVWLTNLPC
jgi:hypothetical protein